MQVGMVIIAIIASVSFTGLIVGMLLGDIKRIRLDNTRRRHPYAKTMRNRPLISFLNHSEIDKPIASYRNKEIIEATDSPRGEYMLMIPRGILPEASIIHSVQYMNFHANTRSLELAPRVALTDSLRNLFVLYGHMASAPFAVVRAGLGIIPFAASTLMLQRTGAQHELRDLLYTCLSWAASVSNILVLLFAGYLAAVLQQSDLLLLYAAAFSVWMVWAVGRYPGLKWLHKIVLVVLLPVSYIYFIYKALSAPLRSRYYRVLRLHRPRNVTIEV